MYKINDSLLERKNKKIKSDFAFLRAIAFIALIVVVITTLSTYVFFNVVVDGASMKPTLYSGDVLIANRTLKCERGSLVVIDGVKEKEDGGYYWLIKRVIAMEGDFVEIKDGDVYVNGNLLEEPYLANGTYTDNAVGENSWTARTLLEGEIFYLGDNRGNSADSRTYGTCNQNQIVGVVEEWSLGMRGFIKAIYNLGRIFRGGH